MGAFPLGAVIGAGASVLGNALGFGSQQSANKTNMRIAQMNNDFGREMFDKQVQYNWDMFNATNEYNSATNQRKRLEDAGLNPYLMTNGGTAGVAQGGSSVSPPTGAPAHVDAFQPNFDSIVNSYLQEKNIDAQSNLANANAQKALAEAENINVGNTYQRRMLESELLSRVDTHKLNQRSIDFGLATFDNDVAINRIQRDIAENTNYEVLSRAHLNEMQAQLTSENIKYVAPQALQAIAESKARAFASFKSGELSRQQAVESFARTLVAQSERRGIILDNETKELTYNRALKTARKLLKTELSELSARQYEAKAREKEAKGTTPSGWKKTMRYIRDVLSLPTVPLSEGLKAVK